MNQTYKEMMSDVADHEGIPMDVLEKAFQNESCIDCYEEIKFFIHPSREGFYKIMAECGDEMEIGRNN